MFQLVLESLPQATPQKKIKNYEYELHYFKYSFYYFQYACLSRCNLSGANLSHCCLERADLSHANLEGAQLLGVKALCANMEGMFLYYHEYSVLPKTEM